MINVCVFIVAENCSGYKTCGYCLDQPGCGWCTDPSNTGRGQCIEGSYRGPIQTLFHAPSSSGPSLIPAPQPMMNVSLCPLEGNFNWSFIQCPGKTYVTCVRELFCNSCLWMNELMNVWSGAGRYDIKSKSRVIFFLLFYLFYFCPHSSLTRFVL